MKWNTKTNPKVNKRRKEMREQILKRMEELRQIKAYRKKYPNPNAME